MWLHSYVKNYFVFLTPSCDEGQVLPSHFWQVFQLSAVSVVFSCLAEQEGVNERTALTVRPGLVAVLGESAVI